MYYTSIILSIFCFYTIPMSYTRGYLPCCYEDVEALCIWDGDIEIFYNEVGFGWAGLTCCYEDIEVLYTWDGNVEILYRGVGFWLGRDSPAAIRM